MNTPNNTPPHVHSANEMLHRTASNSRCRGARTARTHADGKRSPERLYQNRETRSRCGRGPTGDPTCRPSKIQALPYQILHEMKPIIRDESTTTSEDHPQISQLERIKWSVYGSDGDRQATRSRHTAQIRIVIPQTALSRPGCTPHRSVDSRIITSPFDPSSRVFTLTGPAVT